MAADLSSAEREVLQSLKPVTLCMKFIGVSLNDHHGSLLKRFHRFFVALCNGAMTSSVCVYLGLVLSDSSRASVAEFATCVHLIGYGILSK